ncbi:hypothetical protein I4U23_023745 [Adineta vaga]|nr:hypothetical protein I4U23_023745 [Adineta vaga]
MKLLLLLLTVLSINTVTFGITRNGRCPSAQYAFSGLPCTSEGDDSPCPDDYKCCPLTNGMNCFSSCPEFTQPCTIQCPFGLKVDPSPCTTCECAPDPCLSDTCPLGTKCIVKDYEPCAIPGRCGKTTGCIYDPSIHVDPTPKPKNCPEYWPTMGSGLRQCQGPDRLCPGEEKCCQAPTNNFNFLDTPVSYCVQPCEDISNCTLQCSYGLAIDGGCRVCQCNRDPCEGKVCPPGEACRPLPAPCAHFPGRPPCPLMPVCMKRF